MYCLLRKFRRDWSSILEELLDIARVLVHVRFQSLDLDMIMQQGQPTLVELARHLLLTISNASASLLRSCLLPTAYNFCRPCFPQVSLELSRCGVEELLQLRPLCLLIFMSLQYHFYLHKTGTHQCGIVHTPRLLSDCTIKYCKCPHQQMSRLLVTCQLPYRSLSPILPRGSLHLRTPATAAGHECLCTQILSTLLCPKHPLETK